MKHFKSSLLLIIAFVTFTNIMAQKSFYEPYLLEDPEASLKDIGKMWTFDDIPFEYFEEEYGFKPTQEWLDDVQKSALHFGRGCSGSFVSANGLIMSNHHCARSGFVSVQKEGEDILKNGFYAETMEEERRIEGQYVDQLIKIEDVTEEIIAAINEGITNEEKVENRKAKISEIEKRYSDETGLKCEVVTLYNGGKYSLYAYKRYDDIRLVFAPEFQIASTGWDWDNFTYPRYELDFAFFRAYDENGEPVKVDNYFEWSANGAEEDELVFTVGRPGNTDRLLSVAQLEYLRDDVYPAVLMSLNGAYDAYRELYVEYPERESELLNRVMGIGNSRKVFAGLLWGLNDEYLMNRKRNFEQKLIADVKADAELNKKYGHLWKSIDEVITELKQYETERRAYTLLWYTQPYYFAAAKDVVKFAKQLQLPESEREEAYKTASLEETKAKLFDAGFDKELNDKLLLGHVVYLTHMLGNDHPIVVKLYGGNEGEEAVEYMLANSLLINQEKVDELLAKDPADILASDDPFIYFVTNTGEELDELNAKSKEAGNTLSVLNQQLGEVVFAVYGDKIPPDATATLRLSDGRVKGYEYNGTLAPPKTTFHGLYDRYNSFDKDTYPWGLTPKWETPPVGLDLTTPMDIATTNDIVGGNSGSAMINKNAEIIGLVFDGNLESIPGNFIYLPGENRTIAVDSKGLFEALKHVYKAERLVNELSGE